MIEEKALPTLELSETQGIILIWRKLDYTHSSWSLIVHPSLKKNEELKQSLSLYKVVFVGSTSNHPFNEKYIGTEEHYFCCLRRDYVGETNFTFFFLKGDGIPEHFNSVPVSYFDP